MLNNSISITAKVDKKDLSKPKKYSIEFASMTNEEEESMEMEIESDIPQSQQFSQSQAFIVQQDQEQIDRIDFSLLGSNAIV